MKNFCLNILLVVSMHWALNIMIAQSLDKEANGEVPERLTWESDYLKTRDESGTYAKLLREVYIDPKNFRKYSYDIRKLRCAAANGKAPINREE